MLTLYLIVAVMAYLLGSIPFGYLLVRVFRGEDIRLSGSGNIGATNVARSGAKGLGIATLALDALKGALAVWIASVIAGSKYNLCGDFVQHVCVPALRLMAVAALFAVLGQGSKASLIFLSFRLLLLCRDVQVAKRGVFT